MSLRSGFAAGGSRPWPGGARRGSEGGMTDTTPAGPAKPGVVGGVFPKGGGRVDDRVGVGREHGERADAWGEGRGAGWARVRVGWGLRVSWRVGETEGGVVWRTGASDGEEDAGSDEKIERG